MSELDEKLPSVVEYTCVTLVIYCCCFVVLDICLKGILLRNEHTWLTNKLKSRSEETEVANDEKCLLGIEEDIMESEYNKTILRISITLEMNGSTAYQQAVYITKSISIRKFSKYNVAKYYVYLVTLIFEYHMEIFP